MGESVSMGAKMPTHLQHSIFTILVNNFVPYRVLLTLIMPKLQKRIKTTEEKMTEQSVCSWF